MLKVQAVLHYGSVALEFITDDTVEAEEMRVQFLDFDRVAEVRVLDEPGCGVGRICKRSGRKIPRQRVREHTAAADL
jgi:hypothetical protein